MIRAHLASSGSDAHFSPFLDLQNLAFFMQCSACACGCAGEAKRQVQRVQMGSAMIENATFVIGRGAHLVTGLRRQQLYLVITIAILKVTPIVVKMLAVARTRGCPGNAGTQMAVNLVFGNQGFDQILKAYLIKRQKMT